MTENLCYIIPEEAKKNTAAFSEFLEKHPYIYFISLAGVDFLGNDTDESIPRSHFIENMDSIFSGGIQTDGSSVNMPEIATLNDAKIDFVIDFENKWCVHYNREHFVDGNPVGTLRIPIFFKHHSSLYCSRSVLRNALKKLRGEILEIVKNDDCFLNSIGIKAGELKTVFFTLGTELEFWVRSAVGDVSAEQLELSQSLKESYWKRTKGKVRTCMEEALFILENYGLKPEMAHKEVGGVKGKLSKDGQFYSVMEQLEIDWRFSDPLEAADNELMARILIKEIFRRHGLDVTFTAKPVEGVAGSGEHMHLGMGLITKNGKKINLYTPNEDDHYLSSYGYGAIMGFLKHWDHVSPFVSNTISALNRLQPGFEAPVCPVASLGKSVNIPSRNRTVLACLISSDNPLSTRFEIRAPNPHTNTYLATAAMFLAMFNGIKYASGKTSEKLYRELSKKKGDDAGYLLRERQYVSECNIFEDYTEEERKELFGPVPETVYEVFETISKPPVLFENTPLVPEIIKSYRIGSLERWCIELKKKIIPEMKSVMKSFRRFSDRENEYDISQWKKVEQAISNIAKDSHHRKSVMTKLVKAIEKNDLKTVNSMSKDMFRKYRDCCQRYSDYKVNFIV